jgi:hypothetical protein
MIWWVLFMVIITSLSYLADLGFLAFMQEWRVPILNASLLSVLLLLCLIGLLSRMLQMSKKGEKEELKEKIKKLEQEISGLKGQ